MAVSHPTKYSPSTSIGSHTSAIFASTAARHSFLITLSNEMINLRAEVGKLVGYQGSNIYRIWLPHEGNKVIRSTNVTLDQDCLEAPKESHEDPSFVLFLPYDPDTQQGDANPGVTPILGVAMGEIPADAPGGDDNEELPGTGDAPDLEGFTDASYGDGQAL